MRQTRPAAVHPFARTGFGRAAMAYGRARPDYPAAAVAWLVQALGIRSGRAVVDVGAGTGKLTAQLVPTGARIVAVEPVAEMRATLTALLPTVEAIDAVAEALPFETASIDAIVAAQSFHWFDTDAALRSFHRVLRPEGRLGLIWNVRDTSVPWVAAIESILDELAATAPYHEDWRDHLNANEAFGPLTSVEFDHVQTLDRAAFVDRMLSISFIAALDASDRGLAVSRLLAVIDGDEATRDRASIELPYRTRVHWTARLDMER
jgi:SAM-dependent methyltransferase